LELFKLLEIELVVVNAKDTEINLVTELLDSGILEEDDNWDDAAVRLKADTELDLLVGRDRILFDGEDRLELVIKVVGDDWRDGGDCVVEIPELECVDERGFREDVEGGTFGLTDEACELRVGDKIVMNEEDDRGMMEIEDIG